MGYVGNEPSVNFTSFAKQDITGDGGTSYTLTHAVANANEIEVYVNNVRQEPTSAYSASGTALTMTGNVASTDDFYVIYLGKALQTTTPPDGSVSTAKIADDAVTSAKISYPLTTFSSTGIDDNATSTSLTIASDGTMQVKDNNLDLLDSADDVCGRIRRSAGTNSLIIEADPDNSASSSSIQFRTDATERMRVLSGGQLVINATSLPVTGAEKIGVNGGGSSGSVAIGGTCQHNLAIPLYLTNSSNTTNTYLAKFGTGSSGDTRGEIYYNGSSLVYATSSDYRLKENVNYDFDATTKVKQLKPAEYRWIEHQKDDIGFLAHEVQEVFPNAVGGEKDETNADGSIKPQTYDPSKLVPLLVKTIQELEARITALENS